MKNISILGSTGSIGCQSLDVIRRLKDSIKVCGLATYSNTSLLKKQIVEFKPEIAAVYDEKAAQELKKWCKAKKIKVEVVCGLSGLIDVATLSSVTLVLSAVVGSIGLEPLMAAIRKRKTIALANKEALVVAGSIVMAEAIKYGVEILPVDSEHSAIFQCLKDEDRKAVKKIILTASGGPFYRFKGKHSSITVEQALNHPTWNMGPKITIDSATLMNKGLEAIEAHHLFSMPIENIGIVIHPQSIVHSMVEFEDTTTLAHMSKPTMELPIQYALTYPERKRLPLERLDLAKIKVLEFDEPDFDKFPCLSLALEAAMTAGTMPVVMNAANEVAVELFLNKKIGFTEIPVMIRKAMKHATIKDNPSLEDVIELDLRTRNTIKGIK